MLNATAAGNVGGDAKIVTIKDKNYIEFSVATSNKKDQTQWVNCLSSQTNLVDYLKKGQSVVCVGDITVRGYARHDGVIMAGVIMFCEKIRLLGKNDQSGNTEPSQQPSTNFPPARNPRQAGLQTNYPNPATNTPSIYPTTNEEDTLPF